MLEALAWQRTTVGGNCCHSARSPRWPNWRTPRSSAVVQQSMRDLSSTAGIAQRIAPGAHGDAIAMKHTAVPRASLTHLSFEDLS